MGGKRWMEPSSFQEIFVCFSVSDLHLSKVPHRRGHRRGLAFYCFALPLPCPDRTERQRRGGSERQCVRLR